MQKNIPNGIKTGSSDNYQSTVFEDIRKGLQQALEYEQMQYEKQQLKPKEVKNGLHNR